MYLFKFMVVTFLTKEILIVTSDEPDQPCHNRTYEKGKTVCVCNSSYCDSIAPIKKVNSDSYLLYTSNKAGLRFDKDQGKFRPLYKMFWPFKSKISNMVFIGGKKYQEIHGFGGAFTDAACINIKSLSTGAKQNLLSSYFGKNGIEYTLGRVPLGCTDFSTKCYTYDDSQFEDPKLLKFKLAQEDYVYKIPILQEAALLSNNTLKLVGVAWTSPKWMKILPLYMSTFTELKRKMYQPWADYHLKFLEEYDKNNITFWGLSTGNEPSVGYFPTFIPSVAFTASSMSLWISKHLGPTIRKSKYKKIKIFALEDQRTLLPWFIDSIFNNTETKNFVDGISVHWYYDFMSPVSVLDTTHKRYPDKFLISSESCKGQFFDKHVDLGNWERGQDIAQGVIEYLRHWTTAWIDWNIALDLNGGPSYVKNFVDSPIIVNAAADEFYKQPMFYTLGHFSKFVPPGSVRIEMSSVKRNVDSIAFKRPDGGTVVIILNKTDQNVDIELVHLIRGLMSLQISPRSITTIIFW